MILNFVLTDTTGFDVCRQLRADICGLILMLTARDDDIDQIVGLELGADDYVTKPIEPRVLLARVRALLRRTKDSMERDPSHSGKNDLHFGALQVSMTSREVVLDDTPIELTTTEFDLLWLLASQAGEILDRNWLYQHLRGLEYDGLDPTIDIRVSRLRRKLGDNNIPAKRIKTVRGRGYLFVANAW